MWLMQQEEPNFLLYLNLINLKFKSDMCGGTLLDSTKLEVSPILSYYKCLEKGRGYSKPQRKPQPEFSLLIPN